MPLLGAPANPNPPAHLLVPFVTDHQLTYRNKPLTSETDPSTLPHCTEVTQPLTSETDPSTLPYCADVTQPISLWMLIFVIKLNFLERRGVNCRCDGDSTRTLLHVMLVKGIRKVCWLEHCYM